MSESSKESIPRSARQIRRARARRLAIRLGAWVLLPTLVSVFYYGCLASPQYESVAVVSVQSSKGGVSLDGLAAILPAAGGATARDVLVVRQYVRSRAMLDRLDKDQQLIAHYQDADADWWSRLDGDASRQDAYEYFLDKVDMEHDPAAGTLELRVRAYSAEASHKFAHAIIADAEAMVNQMSARAHADRMKLAETEVQAAEKRLATARSELARLQGEGGELDPTKSAAAIYRIKTELETELAKVTAELEAARAILDPRSPEVVQLNRRVSSLRRQITEQQKRLAGNENGGDLTASIAKLEPAVVEKEFAQNAYEAALKSLEVARVEAASQQRYLVTIAEPSLPDVATHPKKIWGILRVFFTCFGLMLVLTLLIASVREHAKF